MFLLLMIYFDRFGFSYIAKCHREGNEFFLFILFWYVAFAFYFCGWLEKKMNQKQPKRIFYWKTFQQSWNLMGNERESEFTCNALSCLCVEAESIKQYGTASGYFDWFILCNSLFNIKLSFSIRFISLKLFQVKLLCISIESLKLSIYNNIYLHSMSEWEFCGNKFRLQAGIDGLEDLRLIQEMGRRRFEWKINFGFLIFYPKSFHADFVV